MHKTESNLESAILNLRNNAHIRVLGLDRPAGQLLAQAVRDGAPVTLRSSHAADDDYTLLDSLLAVETPDDPMQVAAPPAGAGYGAFTAAQRGVLLQWLRAPTDQIAPSYREFYVAHLEAHLLESTPQRAHVHGWMTFLQSQPTWRHDALLARAILLGFRLMEDGAGLANWLATTTVPAQVLETGLAWQAQLNEPLTPAQFGRMLRIWSDQPGEHEASDLPADLLRSRLASLEATLGSPPLRHVRQQWQEADLTPRPWRCAHRDLRIALPQPPVRTLLETPLRELDRVTPVPDVPASAPAPSAPPTRRTDNMVILEFGQSRSDFFDYALDLAQREESFTQLLDENRRMVYRVSYAKNRLRNFWRLWDYVQNWQHTRVYVNGEEMEKWKVWPYSQYMR